MMEMVLEVELVCAMTNPFLTMVMVRLPTTAAGFGAAPPKVTPIALDTLVAVMETFWATVIV